MPLIEVMPIIDTLPHADKFKLMQFLLSLLAKDEGIETELDTMAIAESKTADVLTASAKTNKDNPFCGM